MQKCSIYISCNRNKFQLRDVVDFRPKNCIDTANTDGSSYTNDITTTANVFHGKILPLILIILSIQIMHTLPAEKDKIVLTRDRNFKVIKKCF